MRNAHPHPSTVRPRARTLMALGAAMALVVVGCSDDDGDEQASEDTETTAGDTTTTTVFDAAATCSAVPESDADAVNQGGAVDMIDFEFCQPDLTIESGQAIEFVNYGATRHQVAHQPPGEQEPQFRSDPLLPGDSFVVTLDTPGTYEYICSFHFEQMTGTIVVQ